MHWQSYVGTLFLFCASGAAAEGYIVALGAEADTEDSRAFSAFGELGLGEDTWLSAGAATSRSDGPTESFDAIYADAGIDHFFDPLGVRFAAAYRGDSDVLDSIDLRSSLYIRSDRVSLSADFERRDYDLVVGPPLLQRPRTFEFSADGIGFSARLQAGDRASVYAGGMWYDFSDTVTVQPGVRDLRFLSLSRLVLSHGLLDRKAHAGVEFEFGLRSLDFRYTNWRGVADQGSIDSFGAGFLTPLTGSSDIEVRLSRDDSDEFGDSTVLSVFLYFFGS
jgi:hypothetical protein